MQFLIAALLLLYAQVVGAAQQPSSDVARFNGTWGVTLTCADYKDAGRGAKGYVYRFLAQVKDGALNGEHGQENTSGWVKYEGQIQPDGSAEIQAHGITGSPQTAVGQVAKGTPYSYRLKAHFDESRGTATRIDLRPCEAVFVKQ
jgi:hypothetical protein